MPIVMFSEVLLCCNISKKEEGGEGRVESCCVQQVHCADQQRGL